MKNLKELKEEILADGIIDAGEVNELRTVLYEDGVIDKDEAEFLFDLNDAVSGKDNHDSWTGLFVDAISSFLLDDEESPGEIDDAEALWLFEKLNNDGVIDKIEKALLLNLKAKSKNFPPNLDSLL